MPAPLNDSPPILERNLRALKSSDPNLADRLSWPGDMGHLELGSGPATYRLHYQQLPLSLTDDEVAELTRDVPSEGEVLIFGLGLGELAVHLVRTRPDLQVIAWDRDPSLLKATLTRRDLSAPLAEGNLRLLMAADLLGVLGDREPSRVVLHPMLKKVYRGERYLLEKGLGEKRVALGLGGFVVNDIAEALRHEGYSVVPLELKRWSMEELGRAVDTINPERMVCVNYHPGLSEFCAAKQVPLSFWQVDEGTADLRPSGAPTGETRVFTFRRSNIELFQRAGYSQVEYLPVAAHEALRHPMELDDDQRQRFGSRLSFVGSSMVGSSAEYRRRLGLLYGNWHPDGVDAVDELEPLLDSILAEQRKDYSRYVIPELCEAHLSHFLAAVRRTVHEDPVRLVGEMAASEKRRAWISRLGRFGIDVWGDEPWREVETSGARYRGNADRREELTTVYNASQINIDISRLYQADAVGQRVFDVLACGGFLIAEHSDALAEQFRIGVEIEAYRSLQELEDKVAHYLENPGEAEAIAKNGLEAVRQRHSVLSRVQHLLGQ